MITGGIMDIGGKTDMVLHMTEYGIAAFYEIPHGHGIDAGLDIREGAKQTIAAVSDWLYHKLGLESRLSAFGVTEDRLHDMAVKATENCGGVLHSITTLTVEDVENIFRMCM